MSEVWGLLAKSLTDAQTINEAIDAAIAAHEADASAHLGVGESLESHKTSEIIDHLAGSVLTDKVSWNEDVIDLIPQNLSIFEDVVGSVSLYLGQLSVSVNDPGVTESYVESNIALYGDLIDYSKNMLIQFSGCLTEQNLNFVRIGLGFAQDTTYLEGFGFKFSDAACYGYWSKSTENKFTDNIAVSNYRLHVYRVQYDASTKTMYFFIDGVQKATLTYDDPQPTNTGAEFLIQARAATGDEDSFTVRRVLMSFEV